MLFYLLQQTDSLIHPELNLLRYFDTLYFTKLIIILMSSSSPSVSHVPHFFLIL